MVNLKKYAGEIIIASIFGSLIFLSFIKSRPEGPGQLECGTQQDGGCIVAISGIPSATYIPNCTCINGKPVKTV